MTSSHLTIHQSVDYKLEFISITVSLTLIYWLAQLKKVPNEWILFLFQSLENYFCIAFRIFFRKLLTHAMPDPGGETGLAAENIT